MPAAFAGHVAGELHHLFWAERVQGVFADTATTAVEWLQREGPRADVLRGWRQGSGGGSEARQKEL